METINSQNDYLEPQPEGQTIEETRVSMNERPAQPDGTLTSPEVTTPLVLRVDVSDIALGGVWRTKW